MITCNIVLHSHVEGNKVYRSSDYVSAFVVLCIIYSSACNAAHASIILCSSSFLVLISVRCTMLFKYPQIPKSIGFKSEDLGAISLRHYDLGAISLRHYTQSNVDGTFRPNTLSRQRLDERGRHHAST